MLRTSLPVKLKREPHEYLIHVGTDMLGDSGAFAASCLGPSARKVAVVSNPTVFGLYGSRVCASLRRAGYKVETFLIGDGERYKTLKTAEQTLAFLAAAGIGRTDGVVALGGGVVGDLAGFAAAVHLRGVPFLQIPTTLLAMIDSSVGGKTGVNTPQGKNMVGAFNQPAGVLVDVETLATLHRREVTAGLCEAVKHAALAGGRLFKETAAFLGRNEKVTIAVTLGDASESEALADLVARQIDFKRKIVEGDESEDPVRIDGKSRKILNFGHTFAHALEKATNYRRFRHGEAVGHGIRFASELSVMLDLMSQTHLESLNNVVNCVGKLPPLGGVDKGRIEAALAFDKKNLAGSLQMVLLGGVGSPVIKPLDEVPRPLFRKAFNRMFQG